MFKGKEESHTCPLNQKLDTIKEDMTKARPLVPLSHVMYTEENFLKGNKSDTIRISRMIRWEKSFIGMEKILVICMQDKDSHNIPLSLSLIQRIPNCLILLK